MREIAVAVLERIPVSVCPKSKISEIPRLDSGKCRSYSV
jgi:hypothetical protein